MVDQVACKCYLGLALDKVIKEMNLNSKSHKIFDVFLESFKEKYQSFQKTNRQTLRAEGKVMEHYQYPIGQNEKLQYYKAYGEISVSGTNRSYQNTQAQLATLLQGFSTNEGPKSNKSKRNRNTRQQVRIPQPQKRRKV